ncbi:MAG TPA: hypothetical protein VFA18_16735 [Gemmataceae bacterium]|nr:hypothetical protein [Gemmataceae bacterium]
MFVRFVVPVRHPDSHRLTGIFYAACRLRESDFLDTHDEGRLDLLLLWFNCHLPVPSRLSRSRHGHAPPRAIFWLREGASLYIDKIHALAALVESLGVATRKLRTRRPGYIVYEDR